MEGDGDRNGMEETLGEERWRGNKVEREREI